ncbi:MAG: hypothetical protein K6U80_05555 [Firmicutes bacterium]|nr:hypothetical protein [Bacillota bacterium]
MLKKLDKYLLALTYAYLVFPIILFAFGWINPILAVILTIMSLYAALKTVKDFQNPFMSDHLVKFLSLKILMALAITLAVTYWVYLSGIGGFTYQNEDFELRNAMLRDLTDFNWPVIYDYPAQPDLHELAGHRGALVYYFIYWLPAALFGKIFGGWVAANIFLYIWTVLGILLGFYWFSRKFKRISALLLLLFIFWSGMDAAGWLERGRPLSPGIHLEWWAEVFQYSSNTTCLFWVFNQAVAPWIIIMLFATNRINKKQLLFTYALCLPYGPFSFIGLAPFVAYYLLSGPDALKIFSRRRLPDLRALWHNLKAVVSVSNLLVAPFIMGVFWLFFKNPGSLFSFEFLWKPLFNFNETLKHLHFVFDYFLFCLLEFGIYALLISGKFKKDPVFLIAVCSLSLIPSFCMGLNNDFAMRASIPALLFLMVYVAEFLAETKPQGLKDKILKFSLIGFLLIGAITPFNEIYRSMDITGKNPRGIICDRWHTLSTIEDFKTGGLGVFVVKDPQDTLFFKYLGNNSCRELPNQSLSQR